MTLPASTRALATLVAVFVLGGATGAGGMHYAHMRALQRLHQLPPADARRHVVLAALDHALGLSAEQRAKIGAILVAHTPELQAIERRVEPEVGPIVTGIQHEIRATLTPEQQTRYDVLEARYNERRSLGLGVP